VAYDCDTPEATMTKGGCRSFLGDKIKMNAQSRSAAIRGPAVTFIDDPFRVGDSALRYESDALIIIENGKVKLFGAYDNHKYSLTPDVPVTAYGDRFLILPGFIDAHVHYPQTQIIAAYGKQLFEWLDKYTFLAEQQFADKDHAQEVAKVFFRECLRAGTTTAAVYCTVHPASVDAFFTEAENLDMRMIAGKVLMDRNAPPALLDTPQRGYDESRALLQKWHQRGRQLYAVTPRFAPSSTAAQMEMAAALWHEFPGCYLQSHVSETRAEVDWAQELFPQRSGYLDIYDYYGQLGERAVYGHGVWLTESELQRCHDTGTAIVHCPVSNGFLGSGMLRIHDVKRADRPIRAALGTDLGAGTSFSQLQTMREAYKVAQLNGWSLSPAQAYYLASYGAAHALYLDDRIGSIAPGYEADLVVLDLHSTDIIDFRMRYCESIHQALFIQMMMADDRATRATYVAGRLRYERQLDMPNGTANRQAGP
jgi:guanine deaminase